MSERERRKLVTQLRLILEAARAIERLTPDDVDEILESRKTGQKIKFHEVVEVRKFSKNGKYFDRLNFAIE